MTARPDFRIVENSPWNKAESYRPNLYDCLDLRVGQLRFGNRPRRYVTAFCLAVATFVVVYFPLRFLVGMVS